MSGFPILDLVAGIIFIFFLLSIICSSIVEMVLTATKVRSQILGQWLLHIFDTKITDAKNEQFPLGQMIMDHCAVTVLSDKKKPPAYIDSKNFVSAVIDKISAYSSVINPKSIEEIIKSIESTTAISGELKRTFMIYANEVRDTLDLVTVKTTGAIEMFRHKLENWFDSNMDRLTGTLKTSYTRRFTLIAALILTVLLNADTIAISKYLYNNPEARLRVAAKAYETSADDSIRSDMEKIKQKAMANDPVMKLTINQLSDSLKAKLDVINKANAALRESIPLGWSLSEFAGNKKWYEWAGLWFGKLVGMVITVLAVMMGAPFWFDVLNKVSNIRGNGKKPEESKKTN